MLDYGFNFMNTKIYIDNKSTICIVKILVFHSKTKHIEIRYHFIRDSYEKRLIQVIKIHTDHNVADLLTKAFDVSSDEFGVKTGSCKVNAARQDLVLLGEIISKSSVRSNLRFNDEDGVTSLTNSEILENLALMGYEIISDKLTFQKAFFSPQWKKNKFLLLQHLTHKRPKYLGKLKEAGTLRYLSLVVPLEKVGDEAVHKELGDIVERAATTAASLDGIITGGSPRCQEAMGGTIAQTRSERVPLLRLGPRGDTTTFKELINKNLETQEDFGDGQEVSTATQVSTAGPEVTIADAELNTASTFVSTASPQRNAYTTAYDLTLVETLIEIRKSAAKDKVKRQRMAQVHQAAQGFTDAEWDDVLARVAADEDFVQQLQAGEKCSEEILPMKLVELVNKRKKFFAQQRVESKRNKPTTLAQQKDYMSNYIKNQEGEADQIFADMLKKFNRDDLVKLWDLVKERFSTTKPIDDKEKELWVELKRLFEPDDDDI
ncbi:hypothetical protein Tco_0504551 [Tanacetum coccineum]